MKKFQGTECNYRNFQMKYSYDITFICDLNNSICTMLYVPFNDDVPDSVKKKLNEVLLESMNELSEEERKSPNACNLDVQFKIDYSGENTQYYLMVNVDGASNFNKNILIKPQNEKEYDYLYDEFVSYCTNRLSSVIFGKRTIFHRDRIHIYVK